MDIERKYDVVGMANQHVEVTAPGFGMVPFEPPFPLGQELNLKQTMAMGVLWMFEPGESDTDEEAARELRRFIPQWKEVMRGSFSNSFEREQLEEAIDGLGFSDFAEMAELQVVSLQERLELSRDTDVQPPSDHELHRAKRWQRITSLAALGNGE